MAACTASLSASTSGTVVPTSLDVALVMLPLWGHFRQL